MDILHLVDRLEELFNESRPIWFTHNVIMDEDRLLDIIDQMRVSIPEEIKKSQQLIIQKDRMLAQTQEEANRTLSLAREKADQVIEKDQIVVAAQARGEQIMAQTKQECDQIKREADDYVMHTLEGLKIEMEKSLNQINNGIAAIESTRKTSENIE